MTKRVSRTSPSSVAATAFTLKRSGAATRAGLLLGTALGCSIAVFSLGAPGTAWATNECGPLVTVSGVDQVTCAPGGYPSGITYVDNSGNPVVVTLGSGADPVATNGVFLENQAANAYASVLIDAGSTINATNVGVGAYTSAGGNVFITNSGTVFGNSIGLYGDAINGGSVYITNFGSVSGANSIKATTSDGNVGIFTYGISAFGGNTTATGISAYAKFGTAYTTVRGDVALTNISGYATGVTSAATFDDTQKIYGNVSVTGYSGALGVKTSSANNAYTTVYGNVTVASGYAGNGGGNATGIITVGSNIASARVYGSVSVTAMNGVALGVESSSLNGSYVFVEGSVSATGDLGATGVYDKTIYNHNAGVTVGGNVGAYSSQGTATGVVAVAGNAVANAGTYVDVTVSGNVTVHGYTEGVGIVAQNYAGSVDIDVGGDVTVTATQGIAVGVESVTSYDNTVTVGGSVYVKGGAGAYGVVAGGGNISIGITGDVTAIATAGDAIGVYSAGDNTVHIGGNASAFATGNAIAVQVGGVDGYAYVGGNVTAISTGTGNAEGFYGNATGDVGAHIVGDVYAKAANGMTFGVAGISSGGNVTLYVGGDVYAANAQGIAAGALTEAAVGSGDITIEGNVVARGYAGAIGVAIEGYGNIHVGGSVGAYSSNGNAYGVAIVGTGGYAFVGGNITVVSDYTDPSAKSDGFYGNVSGDVSGHIDGSVSVMGANGTTFGVAGVSSGGNVTLYVGGDVYAANAQGIAAGALTEAAVGSGDITIEGNVVARGYAGAIGVAIEGYGNIHVGGSVGAYSSNGNAYGVAIVGTGGYAFVGGNITVVSGYTDPSAKSDGFYGNVSGDVSGHIDGSVSVMGANGTTFGVAGISSGGNVTLYVGGDVYAANAQGIAAGALTEAAVGSGDITIEGNVVARGYAGAIGVAIEGYGNIHVGGSVGAYSSNGNAYGVAIVGTGGYAFVGGNITVVSDYTDPSAKSDGFYGNVSGDVSGHIDGSVSVMGANGTTFGVAGVSSGGNVTLYVGGDVYAANAQGIAAGALTEAAVGSGDITIEGNVVARGYAGAIGVAIEGYGNIHVGGSVGAYSSNGNAYGVAIVGTGGYAFVGGNITVVSDYTDPSAKSDGFYGNVTGDVSGHIDGSVSVMGANGTTFGVAGVSSGGNVTLYVGGDVYAANAQGIAAGALTEAAVGSGDITIEGNVVARGYAGAIGVAIEGYGNIHVGGSVGAYSPGDTYGVGIVGTGGYAYVGGNVVAISTTSAATKTFGFYGNVTGDISSHVVGDVYARSYTGNAVGMHSYTSDAGGTNQVYAGGVAAVGYTGAMGVDAEGGYVTVHVGGNVFADATHSGDAVGVYVKGDSSIFIGGNAVALSVAGNATAVQMQSTADGYVTVVGNVYAGGDINATGIYNYSTGYSKTVVGGDVEARAVLGQATGVYAYSETGAAYVSVGGNVTAISELGDATGVYASGPAGGTVNVTGSVGAQAYGDAIGVEVLGPSYANVTVGGDVTAIALNGDATGVTASGDDVHVLVGGTVTAYSKFGDATGVSAVSTGYAGAGVDGDVYAIAPDGNAIGVTVKGGLGGFYAGAYVGGNVTVEGEYSAIGVSVTSSGRNSATVGGNVLAIATDGSATGILATSGYSNVTVSVGGSVTAAASAAATGVYADADGTAGGVASVTVTGDVSATAVNGEAVGVLAEGGNADVSVGGNVSALSGASVAVGVEAVGDYGVTVSVGGNVYARSITGPGAIGIIAESEDNVSVTVDGTTEVIGNLAFGVYAESVADGGVTVDVGNVIVHQYDATNPYEGAGVVTYTTGATNITAGEIYTTGNFTDGVRAGKAGSDNGDTTITVGSVETTGAYSPGVWVSGLGNATVTSGTAYTKGYKSDGIYAVSSAGGVTVTSTMVKTLGNYSAGIYAAAGGPVVVNSGTSVTYGYKSDAVVAINAGTTLTDTVAVYSGNAITHGAYSIGIYASGYNSTYVKSNLVVTYGFGSDGIVAESHNGPVTVISGAVHTYYESSDGIVAETYNGNVSVTSGTVLTDGDYAAGILAASTNGSVSVASTYVRTLGNYSYGIEVEAGGDALVTSYEVKTYGDHSDGIGARSLNGNTTVNSVFVYTKGNYSTGIYAESRNGNVTVNSDTVITVGAYSDGVHGYSYNGTTTINSDYVKTSGYHSEGIYAYGSDGVNVNSGTVKTYGEFATGIMAVAPNGAANVTSHYVQTSGDFAPGISAYGYYGATVNNTGLVRTYGYRSDGIDAFAYAGDVNVTSDEVVTYGDYSTGIFAKTYNGDVNVTVTGGVFTYGYDSPGVVAESYNGNVNVYNYGTIRTEGDFSDGIFAGAIGGTAFIYNGGLIRTYGFESAGAFAESIGADTYAVVVNFGTIEAYEGPGIVAESIGGHAEVYNFGHVYGAFGGVILESTEGSYLYNKGSIMGGNGFAIGAYGASVYIENKGAIYGYAILNTANNTLNNQGRWFAYGNSYFGYGNDVVNNHGIIEVAPFSSTPTTVVWSGVTVFNNSNLVDLRNGHTGDVFILDGNGGVGTVWNGLAGSTLAVDASLTTALSSDEMIVGAANGSTSLIVHDVNPGSPGSLNFVGTTVVHAASGTASNFTWGGEQKGFIQYELQFFSGPVDWNIVALPGQAAFEMLKAPEMAQDFWRRTGDAWSAREQEVRDSMWGSAPPTRGEGWEMWAQAQVGGEQLDRTETFNVQGMNFSPNLSTDSDWRGFQMGGDNWTSKNWLWGFTGGFLEQNSVFHFDKNSFDITGWNVGAYTGFTSGAFFANALVKGDWYDIKANMHTVPALETFSGDTWGAKGETGFRFGTPHLYFEPLADLAWTSTHLDNANFTAQDTVFTFGNATSLRGSIGARVGGQWGQLLPYVGLYAAQEFDGKNKMAMITGGGCTGCEMDIEDLKPGAYERADFGFTTTSWNGLEGFLKGETEFGGKTSGFTGRLGVRWRW